MRGEVDRSGEGKRIGLLGGTFDPPTIAHLIAADWVMQSQQLDEIWFLPASRNPLKRGLTTTSDSLRMEMLRAAVSHLPKFSVDSTELDRGGISYTIETLKHLGARYSDYRFFFILGTDALLQVQQWKDFDHLFDLAEFIVVTRPKYDRSAVPEAILDRVTLLEIPDIAISSTLVRELVGQGWNVRHLVPSGVAEIIARESLYRS